MYLTVRQGNGGAWSGRVGSRSQSPVLLSSGRLGPLCPQEVGACYDLDALEVLCTSNILDLYNIGAPSTLAIDRPETLGVCKQWGSLG